MQEMFGRVDANNDDFLDKEELEKMAFRNVPKTTTNSQQNAIDTHRASFHPRPFQKSRTTP